MTSQDVVDFINDKLKDEVPLEKICEAVNFEIFYDSPKVQAEGVPVHSKLYRMQLNFAANIAKRIEKVVAPKLAYLLSQSKTHYLDEPVRLSRYDLDE